MTRAGLLVAGFRCWKIAIEKFTNGNIRRDPAIQLSAVEFARAAEWSVNAAARHLPLRANCLDRALTLWWMLRRRGLPAELRIGARKEQGRFEAHAWVELSGAIFDAAEASGNFSSFERSMAAMGIQAR